jgi:uncharacterized protein
MKRDITMLKKFAEFVIAKRIYVITVIGFITLFFGYHALTLKMVIERENQLPQNHALIKLDNKIVDIFGGSSVAVVTVRNKKGDIYNNNTLGKIRYVTDQALKFKGVKKNNILSITSPRVKDIHATGDTIDINPLLKEFPLSDEKLLELKRRVPSNEIAPNFLVSKDRKSACIFIDYDSSIYFSDAYKEIEKVVNKVKDDDHEVFLGGSVINMHFIQEYSGKMALLFLFAMIIIGLIHFEAFRTVQAIILPLVTALMSVVWGLGILGYFDIHMDAWNSLTPILILAVAAGHAVQILKRYYEEYDHLQDNNLAVIEAVSKVGPTMLIAGTTAVAGFLSLLIFDITTVRVFGLFTAMGILSALILEMTFIPAIRSIIPPALKLNSKHRESGYLDKALERIADQVINRPKLILGISLLVLILSAGGALKLTVNNSFKEAFEKGDKVRTDETFINDNFSGTSTMMILVEGKEADALKSPSVLKAMDSLQSELEKKPGVGKIISLTGFIKQMNMAMHGDNESFYTIPDNKDLIAQYLFFYAPDDLDMVVDRDYKSAVIRVFAKVDHAAYANNLFSDTNKIAAKYFKKVDVELGIAGGTLASLTALNENVIKDKIQNIWQITLIIFLVSALALRSFIGGLYTVIPSLLAIAINFGFMGITNTWLSLSTAAVSALTISIGADYAIYFIFRYCEELKKMNDHQAALRETMLTSGKAIFFVSSAIAAGFAVLLFSGLIYHKHLGGLVALSMITSSLGAVTLLPAMITLFQPQFVLKNSNATILLDNELGMEVE